MLPWVYGFTWQTGNVIFLGIFYGVVAVIFLTFGLAAMRAARDLRSNRLDEIRWHVAFDELADSAKLCRHALSGEITDDVCMNYFDCRKCGRHGDIVALRRADTAQTTGRSIYGLAIPKGRLYHRGHTWVQINDDGTLCVGLDDFGIRILGRDAKPEFPPIGSGLTVNGTAWNFISNGSRIRILSPVDGDVIGRSTENSDYFLKIKPRPDCDLRHLLREGEIQPWIAHELERLEITLSESDTAISLADGGELVSDLPDHYPAADWESIYREMFLES